VAAGRSTGRARRRTSLRLRRAAVFPHEVRDQHTEQEQHVPQRPEPPRPGRRRRDQRRDLGGRRRRRLRRRVATPARQVDHFDRRDEPVAAPRQRLDEQRVACVVAQRIANLAHALVESLVGLDRAVAPQLGLELLARAQLASTLDEERKKSERLGLQRDLVAAAGQARRRRVEHEEAEAVARGGAARGVHNA
jgi:hypothetical protein